LRGDSRAEYLHCYIWRIKQTKLAIQILMQKLNRLKLLKQNWHSRIQVQRVWHTTNNRISRVRQIIIRIYFHAYNRIQVGGGLLYS
jgi:hypothetical protein